MSHAWFAWIPASIPLAALKGELMAYPLWLTVPVCMLAVAMLSFAFWEALNDKRSRELSRDVDSSRPVIVNVTEIALEQEIQFP